jgi:hypothetical protein
MKKNQQAPDAAHDVFEIEELDDAALAAVNAGTGDTNNGCNLVAGCGVPVNNGCGSSTSPSL